MQLGMIGLGRMGANLVRRLTKDGHTCVVYDRNPPREEARRAGVRGRRLARRVHREAVQAARGLGDGARRRGRRDGRGAGPAHGGRRHHHRRRQYVLPRRSPARRRPSKARAFTMSTAAPAAESLASSAATA